MPLRFDLGPFERLHIGRTVLANSDFRAHFVLEGEMPVLRGRDFLKPALATNSLERLYCCVQQAYLEEAFPKFQADYRALMAQAQKEQPECRSELKLVDTLMLGGDLYKALRGLRKLVRPEVFVAEKSDPDTYARRVPAHVLKSPSEAVSPLP